MKIDEYYREIPVNDLYKEIDIDYNDYYEEAKPIIKENNITFKV